MYDVAISGGGPAGAYCARRCAQAGLSTVLIERHTPPWTKTCAGGVLPRAVSKLDFELPSNVVEKEIMGLRVMGEGFNEVLRFDRCLTYTVDRTNFDECLLKMAERAGAEIITGSSVDRIIERDTIELETGSTKISARCAIIAEGVGSRNADRLLGPSPRGGKAMGVRSIVNAVNDPGDEIEVFLLDTPTKWIRKCPMLPLMGWMFPYRERANFGVGGYGYSKDVLYKSLDKITFESLVKVDAPVASKAHPIPILPRKRLATNKVMLIGDTAGMVSPLSGEGLSHGLASSILAAEAAKRLVNGDPQATRRFERAVKDTVIRDITAAALMSPVLHWLLGVVDTGAFFKVIKEETQYFESWGQLALGHETWQSLLIKTIPRFHRLFFRSLV